MEQMHQIDEQSKREGGGGARKRFAKKILIKTA